MKKTYSKEFKEESIRLVKEDGLTCIQVERNNRTIEAGARNLEIIEKAANRLLIRVYGKK